VAFHALVLETPLATSPTSSLAVSVSSLPSGSSFAVTSEKPQSASQVVLLPPLKISNPTPGRIELRAFLVAYLLTLPLQLIATGSFLEQGTTTLVVITAIHAGAIAALFWMLLGNALVATQIVEDGTPSSLIVRLIPPLCPCSVLFFLTGTCSAFLYFFRIFHGRHHLHLP